MSHGIYDRCVCGHRHPEHTMFGTCHGCLNCTDDVYDTNVFDDHTTDDDTTDDDTTNVESAQDAEDEHPYQQCDCRKYVLGMRGEPSVPSEHD